MPKAKIDKAPHLWWSASEARAVLDIAGFYAGRRKLRQLPKGDGHSVLVIPGFLSGDSSTLQLRGLLRDLGYRVYGWRQGTNTVFNDGVMDRLEKRLDYIYKRTKTKVSLIGWSLGGVYARELAKRAPGKVRLVISMGSPISGNFNHTPAFRIYTAMNGTPDASQWEFFKTLKEAPPVPTTSIYSKSDGVVAWRNSIQAEADGFQTENIRIRAAHLGMGSNVDVMKILADRLAQPEGEWKPYVPPVKDKKAKAAKVNAKPQKKPKASRRKPVKAS